MKLQLDGLKNIRPRHLATLGAVCACLFWFIESAIDTFIFEQQRLYLENLLRPELTELWNRCQVVFLLIAITLLAMLMLHRQHKITRQLKKYKLELEDTIFERTSDLRLKNAMLENEIMNRLKNEAELLLIASIDPLTCIPNRRKFNEVLSYELQRESRYQKGLSLILCDLDHFKRINDEHGHNIGDEVLREFSRLVSENIRKTDIFARWGGEEFAILLPETDLSTAFEMAEKLRLVIEKHQLPNVGKYTASFGVTQVVKDDNEIKIINRADKALYKAKENGRNKVKSNPRLQTHFQLSSVMGQGI
ncbi:MAG: diguanylate cyclase [Gammaproteobacteria bacterium]|nr:diguanylate cyclase [Gammaproteobacteria bacterium]